MRALAPLLALLVLAAPGARAAAAPDDRLARFRELGLRYASGDADAADAQLAEALFGLVDAEIIENLSSGELFSSPAFLEERLDELGGAWGGMSLRLARPAALPAVLVAVLGLAGSAPQGSLRFYGTGPGGFRLLASVTRPGRPDTHRWPAASARSARIAASWVGAGAPGVGHAVWLEVWELRAGREAVPVWQSAAAFPGGLVATGFAVGDGQIAVRYPAPYAGFKTGCEEQTEQVEVYRVSPPGTRITLQSRRVSHPWHRELSESVARLFIALEADDRRTLASLVPDVRLRGRLPARLRPDGACEQREEGGRAVIVAAVESRGAALRPWSLRFVRAGAGWRLVAASPVLE